MKLNAIAMVEGVITFSDKTGHHMTTDQITLQCIVGQDSPLLTMYTITTHTITTHTVTTHTVTTHTVTTHTITTHTVTTHTVTTHTVTTHTVTTHTVTTHTVTTHTVTTHNHHSHSHHSHSHHSHTHHSHSHYTEHTSPCTQPTLLSLLTHHNHPVWLLSGYHGNTVVPLYSGHPWDRKVSLIERCPHFRGQNVHNTNVWDSTSCPD